MMRGFETWEDFESIFRKAFNVPADEKINGTESTKNGDLQEV